MSLVLKSFWIDAVVRCFAIEGGAANTKFLGHFSHPTAAMLQGKLDDIFFDLLERAYNAVLVEKQDVRIHRTYPVLIRDYKSN